MPRRALAVALALVAPGLALAQMPSDALFRSHVAGAGSVTVGPLGAHASAPRLPSGGAVSEAEEEGTIATTQQGWFAGHQRYAVGGVAALAAGVALTQYAGGAQAAGGALGAGGGQAAMPTTFGAGGALPPGLALDPAVSDVPAVIVNPEPGTVLLLGTGLGGLLVVARRRRRAS